MKVIVFLADCPVVDRIIDHLKLTFVADIPPPPHFVYQEALMAAEAGENISHDLPLDQVGRNVKFPVLFAARQPFDLPGTIRHRI